MRQPAKTSTTIDAAILQGIADEAAAAFNTGARRIEPFTARYPGLTFDDACRITALANERRIAQGYRCVGRKIGFTNRAMWATYGVRAPNWGYIYDRTVHDLADFSTTAFPLAPYSAPKIEPEIIFALARAPSPGVDDETLLSCIAWVAHGYEIVQSIFPGWVFAAPDTVIANALHGALLIGRRHPIGARADDWLTALTKFDVALFRNGALKVSGRAADLLEGPVSTIRYIMELLVRDSDNPPLAAGEIISTGTLTLAQPVKAGETWTSRLKGIALEDATITFA